MDFPLAFSPVNALWSLLLFGILIWKIWRLRREIQRLTESLQNIGDPFIRSELDELKESMNTLRARVQLSEERLGMDRCTG